jgi:hypothetical protein
MLKTDIIFSDNKLSVQDWITTGLWGGGGFGVLVTWCHRIRWELTGYKSYLPSTGGWPEGWSVAMAIETTGWNGAIGVFRGLLWAHEIPAVVSVQWHLMAHQLSPVTWLKHAGYGEKNLTALTWLHFFPHNWACSSLVPYFSLSMVLIINIGNFLIHTFFG